MTINFRKKYKSKQHIYPGNISSIYLIALNNVFVSVRRVSGVYVCVWGEGVYIECAHIHDV